MKATEAMRIQTIQLATSSASYGITVGSGVLRTLSPRLQNLIPDRPFRTFVVTSPAIWKLWSDQVLQSFADGNTPRVLFVAPGEQHKRFATLERLAERLVEEGADRDALLIAFGGGVIGDITGFLAAIFMRGVPYVQIPTTLLAQVDSSVGGKTGINLAAGKNLVGSFHHPRAVYVDPDLLRTLPSRELRAGLQEAVKAGIISNKRLFSLLEKNVSAIREGELALIRKVVTESIKVKADVVGKDEKEAGLRMILNFGHTLGHAIEAVTSYQRLLHGEAVAWGAIAALHLSLRRGTISSDEFARMANLIVSFGPLPRFKAAGSELVALTASDKKNRSGKRAFVVAKGIGCAEIVYDVTDEELLIASEAMLADMRSGVGA